jgi:dipeptidyl aminopeptidase/acylaminoacyl peptidase
VTDISAAWNPVDGTLVVARVYLDGRSGSDAQVYRIDVTDPAAPLITPLVTDPAYYHSALSWSPTGEQLAMMRGVAGAAQPIPGIWVYDQKADRLWQVAENGFLPQWLP